MRSIAVAIAEAETRQIPADLEFQMLYGMAEGLMETVSNSATGCDLHAGR